VAEDDLLQFIPPERWAAREKPGRKKASRSDLESLEKRRCDTGVAGVAIVEGNSDCSGGQSPAPVQLSEVRKAQHGSILRYPFKLLAEMLGRDAEPPRIERLVRNTVVA
jgi:hypothetical protein